MSRRIALVAAAFSVAISAIACKKDDPAAQGGADDKKTPTAADFGEPIGARVEGKGDVPTFEVAFAVTKGRDPAPLLGPLTGALSKAIAECPAFVVESAGEKVTAVQLSVDKGKAKVAPYKDPTPGVQCVAGKLEGKELASETFPGLDARAEIRFPSKAAPAGSP